MWNLLLNYLEADCLVAASGGKDMGLKGGRAEPPKPKGCWCVGSGGNFSSGNGGGGSPGAGGAGLNGEQLNDEQGLVGTPHRRPSPSLSHGTPQVRP